MTITRVTDQARCDAGITRPALEPRFRVIASAETCVPRRAQLAFYLGGGGDRCVLVVWIALSGLIFALDRHTAKKENRSHSPDDSPPETGGAP